MSEDITAYTATIANSAAVSDVLTLDRQGIIQIIMPAAWTAANLTFLTGIVSSDATTLLPLYHADGTEYVVTAAAGRVIILPPSDFAGFRYLQIRSGTAGTPVNQGAARALILVARAI